MFDRVSEIKLLNVGTADVEAIASFSHLQSLEINGEADAGFIAEIEPVQDSLALELAVSPDKKFEFAGPGLLP